MTPDFDGIIILFIIIIIYLVTSVGEVVRWFTSSQRYRDFTGGGYKVK